MKVGFWYGRIGAQSWWSRKMWLRLEKAGANVAGIFYAFLQQQTKLFGRYEINEQLEFYEFADNLSDKLIVHMPVIQQQVFGIVKPFLTLFDLGLSCMDWIQGNELDFVLSAVAKRCGLGIIIGSSKDDSASNNGWLLVLPILPAQKEEYIATVPPVTQTVGHVDLQGFSACEWRICEIVDACQWIKLPFVIVRNFQSNESYLIGQESDKVISATDLAQKRGTQLITKFFNSLSDRIPRLFKIVDKKILWTCCKKLAAI